MIKLGELYELIKKNGGKLSMKELREQAPEIAEFIEKAKEKMFNGD